MAKKNFLILEDDPAIRRTEVNILSRYGNVFPTNNLRDALKVLDSKSIDLAIVDLEIDGKLQGHDLLKKMGAKSIPSIVVSSHEEESVIKRSFDLGTLEFIDKINLEENLPETIIRVLIKEDEEEEIKSQIASLYITQDEELINQIYKALSFNLQRHPLLITGPSGSGKTHLANIIHCLGARKKGPFVDLPVTSIKPELMESEVFGHVKGAFTGADTAKKGKLAAAINGTIFIDEIGDAGEDFQKRFLRFFDAGYFEQLGGSSKINSNAHVIMATWKSLEDLVESGAFRSDFYARIEGRTINVKPLSERRDDIPLLTKYFQKKIRNKFVIDEKAKVLLYQYDWFGGVRELKKLIGTLGESGVKIIYPKHLPIHIVKNIDPCGTKQSLFTSHHKKFLEKVGFSEIMSSFEQEVLHHINEKVSGNGRLAEEKYKINWKTFYRKLKAQEEENLLNSKRDLFIGGRSSNELV